MVLAELEAGYQFESYSFAISSEKAAAYIAAVADDSPVATAPGTVPPMAVIAAALSRTIHALSLGGGTIHAGQEVEFDRPVQVGEEISVETTLRANRVRRGARFATIETELFGSDGQRIARSTSAVIIPA